MAAFFTSSLFYSCYIGLMFLIFAVSWFFVLRPYSNSKKAAASINAKLTELAEIQNVSEKFHLFNEWVEQNENRYIKKSFLPAWNSYYQKYMFYQQKGISYTPDIYDFFFEESLVHNFGKRKYAEIVAGIFLSMGIVGTFIGIAFGVSGLHVNGSTDVMQDGIGVLLTGMKVKFASSIVGIILSLFWQLLDKGVYYPGLSRSFSGIRKNLDEAFPTQDQSTLLYSMDQRQEKQMQDFQSFLSEVLIPNMVNGVADSIQKSLAPQMEQTQQMMSDLMQTTTVNQAQGMQQMIDQFVTQLNELTGDHMKNLGDALNSTIEWQQKVHAEMGALVQSMQESASSQSAMVDKTTGLAEQIHSYTERITDYQSVLEKTVAELNATTEKNSELQSITTELLDKMMEERKLFNEYFDSHMSTLKENVGAIVNQTGLQVSLQQRFEENLQRISNITQSQQTLAVTLSQQADLSQRSNQELELIFDKFTHNNSEFIHIQDDLRSLIRDIQQERKEMDGISSRVQTTLTEQLTDMDVRVEQLRLVWESASESMAKTNKHLETSMNQFADDMHRGLQNTFTQFDQELTKSVQHLASGVDAIQEGLIDLPDTMQTLKQAVNEMNRQSKRILNPVTSE
ncbi:hypothetical protein M4D81_05685 [Paenibacillus sp. p3-SID867]|uniref:hypothetical protein n=1 Tax=Paenibacillus sp. p3-SID867 TaxID=2916363 RepID=UPI0021A8E79B|nr:hypothetical protein [Paenibacillus sp. p3-SID867]MCT1398495.1 hypothetical protein [Paenibacillus sp. p3-SID867]